MKTSEKVTYGIAGLGLAGIVTFAALTFGPLVVGARTAPAPTVADVGSAQDYRTLDSSPTHPALVVIAVDEPPAESEVVTDPEPQPVSGRKVPWIPSSDPQNAAGGDWDMSVCEGGSASTGSDGTPYCD